MHLMIDIETLATTPDAKIVSIAAATFDPDGVGTVDEFYQAVDITTQEDRRADMGTVQWWMQQGQEAQQVFNPSETMELDLTLKLLRDFIQPREIDAAWANSPEFDLQILAHAWSSYTLTNPIPFWQHRDVRTLKNFVPACKEIPFDGSRHNALDDVRYQVAQIQCAYALTEGAR